MKEYIEISKLPVFEVTTDDDGHFLLLPFEHLSDIPTADVVSKEQYDDLYSKYCNLAKILNDKLPPIVEMINNSDVVEVVRCKDCENCETCTDGKKYCELLSDGWGDDLHYVYDDGYCSCGVRKDK